MAWKLLPIAGVVMIALSVGIFAVGGAAGWVSPGGMMGSSSMGGMMGSSGSGGMMGSGMRAGMANEPMMVWQQGNGPVAAPPDAAKLALAVVSGRGWDWLTVDEVHVFPDFYEVETDDRGGYKGTEIYVSRQTGAVGPEMGPNLMWDNSYGMGGGCGSSLDEATARQTADAYLSQQGQQGIALGDAEQHHGYWEFELRRGSAVVNQINVNDCTRAVIDERMWQPDMQSSYVPNG